jgi:hypothetical protein
MSLRAVRPRHVYIAAVGAFLLLGGFEAARMAAGDDPALAARARATPAAIDQARGSDPYRAGRGDPYGAPPDGGVDPYDPGDQGGFDPYDPGGSATGARGVDPGGSGGPVPETQTRQS